MKLNLDTIKFETRNEVRQTVDILMEFIEQRGESETPQCVKELVDCLNEMYRNW